MTVRYSWQKFLQLSKDYRQIQIDIMERVYLPDMGLRELIQWGTLLVNSLRHSHKILRKNTDEPDVLEHWLTIRRHSLAQLTETVSLINAQLETGEEALPVFVQCQVFNFASLCSSVLQEEADIDREQLGVEGQKPLSLEQSHLERLLNL